MSPPTVCVSDIHGAFFTLIRLLNQVAAQHPGARLVSLGDEIDRGPHSRQVVEFMMEHQIPSTASNHIDLCLAYSAHTRRGFKSHCSRFYARDVWLGNGGDFALGNWPLMRDPGDGGGPYQHDNWMPDEVLKWMQALPPYLFLDGLDEQGRRCLASHTGYALEADDGGWMGALWGRHPGDGPFPEDGHFRVFGHNREREPAWTDRSVCIDTGAAYEGYRTLTAFLWPSKTLVQQAFDETPVEQRFKVVGGCLTP